MLIPSRRWLVGKNGYLSPGDIALWDLVKSGVVHFLNFAASYVAGAFNARGFPFLESLEIALQPPEEAAKVIWPVPFERRTWEWVDGNLEQVFREAYWQLCRGFVHSQAEDDVSFAIERLLEARRAFTAADVLQMAIGHTAVDVELIYRVLEAGLSMARNRETIKQFDSYATQQLIKHLQEHSPDQLPRLARIEWGYLPILDDRSSKVEPRTLINELQTAPSSFVELLKVVYRGVNEQPREEPLTEIEQNQWRLAHDLLDAFSKVPGADAAGAIDESRLSEWTTGVRLLAQQVGRLGVADRHLGRLFSRYPRRVEADWPPLPICRVMEASGSDELFEGLVSGLIKGRGVTSRAPTTGGEPERELAAYYRGLAGVHQSAFPRLAVAFVNLAEWYERYAEGEDEEAERRRLER